jgi:methylmalonyl-CoA/ethylmalonyl-CoA epimerase
MIPEMQYHHVGIACENINATAEHYEQMGYTKHETIVDPLQNIKICFLSSPTNPMIELLAPVDEKSPVVQILAKNGTSPYHICYTVPDIKNAIKQLKRQRYVLISSAKPACALDNKEVAFLFHKDVGLIELLQQ